MTKTLRAVERKRKSQHRITVTRYEVVSDTLKSVERAAMRLYQYFYTTEPADRKNNYRYLNNLLNACDRHAAAQRRRKVK